MMTQNLSNIFESHLVPRNQKNLKILIFLLFDHIGGLNTLISSVKKGMSLAITNSRNPDDIIKFIYNAKINILPTTPTFINMLLLSEEFASEKLDSLKLITYGTEKMPPGTLKKINKFLPNTRLLQTFGTSETGIVKTKSKSSNSLYFKIIDSEFKVVENELFLKLGLDEYQEQILIFPHDQVKYYLENFDVLIIDEAHNITRFEDTETSESYEVICAKADVLLLLTATPPMGDYKSFYKILQLLDPEQYSSETRQFLTASWLVRLS